MFKFLVNLLWRECVLWSKREGQCYLALRASAPVVITFPFLSLPFNLSAMFNINTILQQQVSRAESDKNVNDNENSGNIQQGNGSL